MLEYILAKGRDDFKMDPLNKETLYELVNQLSIDFFQKPFMHEVTFNHRLRTTGGRYLPFQKVIELNPRYVTEMDEQEFIGIIKHELCHYHLHIEGQGYGHRDQAFKKLLKKTGSPRYCKPLPSTIRNYRHFYICKKCNFTYKRMRRVDTEKYRCGKCRGKITML